jgi:two-component system, OmpR family, sensor histidine kinase VicK
MYSTANAFHRQEYAGAFQLLKEAPTERRILTPEDELILETESIKPHLQTKVSIMILDKKYSLAIELKDDKKTTSIEAIGLATYSNSQSTVLSYASIFESLWTQTDLFQQLRESEKVKDDFVNVAAHELRISANTWIS